MRSAETFGETTTFSYDPLGRRIAKRTRHACTLFGWDGDTLAFESTQSTEGWQANAWQGDSVHYIHEPGSFVPLVQIRQAQAVVLSQTTDVKALMADNGGRYDIELDPLWNGEQSRTPAPFVKEEIGFYQCDHLGTPQELTDHEGRVAWSASYKAWGEARLAISEAGRKAGFRNSIRFQGQYWDEETGLHYNRYRYYDPQTGRFTSKDPIGLNGGLNVFEYASNAIEWVDPFGLSAASGLPRMKGLSVPNIAATLKGSGFAKKKDNGVNETWENSDGSEVRVHKYGNKCACPYKSGNNAHVHKEDPGGNQLNDRGFVSLDPRETHIGIRNPVNFPFVRGRAHGS